jgi:fatty acyl-CoA reductase
MGLDIPELDAIRHNVHIIIHAASSINLSKGLPSLMNTVIRATEKIANFALTCDHLDRFVYVSTAYANTHLYHRSEEADVEIKENFYDLENEITALPEWTEVQKFGTSHFYEEENFPWAYAYAKNLTERLLLQLFSDEDLSHKLLVVRPSVIGPAQNFPFPGYSVPMSTPLTIFTAAMIMTPSWTFRSSTRLASPDDEVNIDEVPVDVVVDRLLCHMAFGTIGCFHAVSGERARMYFHGWRKTFTQLRNIPWVPHPVWVLQDWKSPNQHMMSRLYVILGASFCFSEHRTVSMSLKLRAEELVGLQLFASIHPDNRILERIDGIRQVMDMFASKNWWAFLIVWIFYRNFGKAAPGLKQRSSF